MNGLVRELPTVDTGFRVSMVCSYKCRRALVVAHERIPFNQEPYAVYTLGALVVLAQEGLHGSVLSQGLGVWVRVYGSHKP